MTDPRFLLVEGEGPIVATAIHDGHGFRDECLACTGLDDATRLLEEDPYTGRVAQVAPTHLIAARSRFEVDLNRPRDQAVYRCAADAWGLDVWREPLADAEIERSLADYDAFYDVLGCVLRDKEQRYGGFVVLDIHSYNHRRGGKLADPATNPEINIGTGTVDRARWGALVDRFCADLAGSGERDVRENVKFRGGHMSRWIHETFPATGCALAIELKKTFMDECTGEVYDARLATLARAVAATLPGLAESLRP